MTTQLKRGPPFKAEHLGSILRPETLLKAKDAFTNNEIPQEQLKVVEDEEIKKIVETQIKLGFHGVNDGEWRRDYFWGRFYNNLDGYEGRVPPKEAYRIYVPDVAAWLQHASDTQRSVICVGKIKHVGSSYLPEWNYLKSLLPSERVGEAKLTLAAPTWYHFRYRTGQAYEPGVYANDTEFFKDLAQAYRDEIKILYDAGLRNLQIDDPNLAYFCHKETVEGFKQDGENAEELFDTYIKLYNDCFGSRPADMHIGVHICRGNYGTRYFAEGGYDAIAKKLFKQLDVDTFFLEYDSARAGGFEPLKELPTNKNVRLGIITTKYAKLEDENEVKEKINKAAELIAEGNGISKEDALKQIGLSPQCGFASHARADTITHDDMIAKLKLVRKIADDIWPGQP